jgi:hypothetical protein
MASAGVWAGWPVSYGLYLTFAYAVIIETRRVAPGEAIEQSLLLLLLLLHTTVLYTARTHRIP